MNEQEFSTPGAPVMLPIKSDAPFVVAEEISGAVLLGPPSQHLGMPHETPGAGVENGGARRATRPTLERLTDTTIAEHARRKHLLADWLDLKKQGYTRGDAAKLLSSSPATLWRLETGKTTLEPQWHKSGRTSSFQWVLSDEPFCQKLMALYLATIGASGGNVTTGRRTAKMATALTCLAEEPECPAALADRLRRGKFPSCLTRWLRKITPEMEARFRGTKHFQLSGLNSRRDLTLRFPNGERADMPAGFKWVFDDMSSNQPFWVSMDGSIMFSRQGLYALDHRSLRWLGKMLVARPREAYRSEDILRFLRMLFTIYGKPDVIVFEQSVWRARKLRGFKISETSAVLEEEFQRPEMAAAERDNLSRGLEAIGVRIIYATSAHGKIIETCFNHLQNILAIKARQFVNIGRHAGEFEVGAKRMRQVRAGSHAPGDLGFATITELSDCIDQAFVTINGKTNSRGEVPDEIWTRDLAARPLLQLAGNDAAAFLPEMREAVIKGGTVSVVADRQVHDFRAEWMIQLGTTYKVFIKFDPSEPTLGAALYNREMSSANHRLDDDTKTYQLGEFIGFASWEMPAPSADVLTARGIVSQPVENYYPGAIDQGDTVRRLQSKSVATVFSALPRPGQPAIKQVETSDGLGNLTRVERGSVTRSTGEAPDRTELTQRRRVTTHETRPLTIAARGVSEEEFERQAARLAREEQRNQKAIQLAEDE